MPQYSPSPALAQPASSVTSPQRPQPFAPSQPTAGQLTQQSSFNVQPVPNQALSVDRSKYPDLASTPLSAQERFHESIEEHIPIAVSDDGYADFTEEKFPNPALPVSAPSVSPGGSAVRNRDTLAAQNGLGASVYSTAFEAFPQQALPKDLEQLLNSLSKEKLKTLFLDTFTLLTMRPPREFRTSNEVLSQFLKRSHSEINTRQCKYIGQTINGFPNGKGFIKNNNGTSYAGEFFNGEAEGTGTFEQPSGVRFTGDFSKGLRNGLGTMFIDKIDDRESVMFYGSFKNDKRAGPGVTTYKNGDMIFAMFENDKEDGISLWVSSDRSEVRILNLKQGKPLCKRKVLKLVNREQKSRSTSRTPTAAWPSPANQTPSSPIR